MHDHDNSEDCSHRSAMRDLEAAARKIDASRARLARNAMLCLVAELREAQPASYPLHEVRAALARLGYRYADDNALRTAISRAIERRDELRRLFYGGG